MALVKRLFLVGCCVLLIFCFALPAFAFYPVPDDLSFTAWRFDPVLQTPPFTAYLSTYIGGDVSFTVGDYVDDQYTDMYWDGQSGVLYYEYNHDQLVPAYNAGFGWANSSFRNIVFTISMGDISGTRFGDWLFDNSILVYHDDDIPSVTWSIDGQLYPFSDGYKAPSVTLTVTDHGATLFYYTRSFAWTNTSPLQFQGFSLSQDNTPIYTPGNTYLLSGGSGIDLVNMLYPCYADSPICTTTIKAFNNDGTYERFAYSAFGEGASPLVQVRITETGFDVYKAGQVVQSFYVDREQGQLDDFIGFSTRPNSFNPTYAPGATITVGNTAANADLNLYVVFKTGFSDPSNIDITDWIMTAVGGFFAFELWPGLSLGDLVLTILSIGLLFSFLKLTI